MYGVIKAKHDEQGFGFITPSDGGKDLFFHFSGCVSSERFEALDVGMEVFFEVQDGKGGKPMAVDVSVDGISSDKSQKLPGLVLNACVEFSEKTTEGILIRAVAIPWFEIIRRLEKDPEAAYQIGPYVWEEIIAGAYTRAGFDEVILTPRSGDKGRDVVATKFGVGSIRIFDQVKAYRPGHVVTADEVRAMLGVITGAQNVSKGIITTTSSFAPRLLEDKYIKSCIPYRLELKSREKLFSWLSELSQEDSEPTQ